ncbi:uncharacterized protein LOC110906338 [Helianthus annuus]|uniref:uncharacterized protein LOC110906338 n=1 Tax=Helianthus annuus TaxID=4232 RepID=UPI000B8FC643|nr:uncharacterized protein LOC110906338 [Helianthus annuus]
MKAYRAKVIAKKQAEGDYTEQYSLLRDYAKELLDKNPGSTVKIDLETGNARSPTRQCKRMYVCLAALKQGFKALGRDFIGLDGAFMKGPFPGQILTAVGVDCNNGLYPVCYAIVGSESLSSWTWFLELLADDLDLHSNSNFTFISDRQKGILPTITKFFPCAEHRYCLRHIHENMKLQFKGNQYKDKLWNCATVTTIPEFATAIDELKFENIKKEATFYRVQWNGWVFYEVSGKPNHARVVNLEKRTCMPCRHAVAALWEMGATGGRVGALESWVHPVYIMKRWKLVYSHKINPINGRTMWAKVQCPITIRPPKHHTQVGRPKKTRKRSAVKMEDLALTGRLTKKNTKGKCTKCGAKGHNIRTCKGEKTGRGAQA